MDLDYAGAARVLVLKTRQCIKDVVLADEEAHGGIAPGADGWRRELQQAALSAGVFGPGLGVSEDLPLARIYREVRPFRIYDGPSKVHRWTLAKRAVRRTCDQLGQA